MVGAFVRVRGYCSGAVRGSSACMVCVCACEPFFLSHILLFDQVTLLGIIALKYRYEVAIVLAIFTLVLNQR